MTGTLITCRHETLELPVLLSWRVVHTGGVPCDSYQVTIAYEKSMAEALHLAAGFLAEENGDVMLRGIVDEYTVELGAAGLSATIVGRGYAARLLDNESRPMTYEAATLEEILRNHVTPYGIQTAEAAALRAAGPYTVAAGTSQWKALEGFAGHMAVLRRGLDGMADCWRRRRRNKGSCGSRRRTRCSPACCGRTTMAF